MSGYLEYNQRRWNEVSRKKANPYTIPISHEDYVKQKDGPIQVVLTVGKTVPGEWFERAPGKKLLGLACGGGQQGPIFASHGYDVTIMDYSQYQLEADRMVAEREGISIRTVLSDMTQTFPFEDESFDIIFCPVSNVYIEELDTMWRESYRVLRKGDCSW